MYKIIKWSICLMWITFLSFLCFKPKQTEFKLNETPKNQQLNVAAVDDTFTLNAAQLASWGVTSGSITFRVTGVGETNTVTINDGRSDRINANNLTIPSTVADGDGVKYQITAIGSGALGGEQPISVTGKLTLPASLKRLEYASCGSIRFTGELIIPVNVESIATYAFYMCGYFSTLTFKNNNTVISNAAFSSCNSVRKLNLPFMEWPTVNLNCFSSLSNRDAEPTPPIVVVPVGSSITLDQLGLSGSNWILHYSDGSNPQTSHLSWLHICLPLLMGGLIGFIVYTIYKRRYSINKLLPEK